MKPRERSEVLQRKEGDPWPSARSWPCSCQAQTLQLWLHWASLPAASSPDPSLVGISSRWHWLQGNGDQSSGADCSSPRVLPFGAVGWDDPWPGRAAVYTARRALGLCSMSSAAGGFAQASGFMSGQGVVQGAPSTSECSAWRGRVRPGSGPRPVCLLGLGPGPTLLPMRQPQQGGGLSLGGDNSGCLAAPRGSRAPTQWLLAGPWIPSLWTVGDWRGCWGWASHRPSLATLSCLSVSLSLRPGSVTVSTKASQPQDLGCVPGSEPLCFLGLLQQAMTNQVA